MNEIEKKNTKNITKAAEELMISQPAISKSIKNLEELDNYRRKLEHYGELIGHTDNYTFFDDYYTEKMSALEHKCNVLENGGIETALEAKKPNKFVLPFL